MTRIERPPAAIERCRAKPVKRKTLLQPVVAISAERLQLAQQEGVPVAAVRADMVGYGGDSHKTAGLAHSTHGEVTQLQPSAASPPFELIPLPPWTCLHCQKRRKIDGKPSEFLRPANRFRCAIFGGDQEFESSPCVRESRYFEIRV